MYKIKYKVLSAGILLSVIAAVSPADVYAQDEYWRQRVSLFDKLPVGNGDIVFLGNSITDGGEFQELFGMENVLNRGIRSDRINGVRKRLDQVTSGHPKKIFLLIGINDVADTRQTSASIAAMYETLVKEIREKTPETELYIQSVMPINNDFKRYKSLIGRESVVTGLNEKLRKVASDNGAVFIDLWPALSDPATGKLQKQFTNDGLHLTGAGYRAWTNAVRSYVTGVSDNISDVRDSEKSLQENTEEPLSDKEQSNSISIIKRME
ncbi:MAG: hypothetical protein HDS25_08590 [Bacteroides sp.]|nr:hypothetical protein [Bacteroides sp.]